MHNEVSESIVPASHIHNRSGTDTNLHYHCVTSEYVVRVAEKGVDFQTTVSLEEHAKLINVSPFTQGDNAVMHVRLHGSVAQEALSNGKAPGVARAIGASRQHSDLARFAP